MTTSMQQQSVNIGGTEVGAFTVKETFPPNSPFSSLMNAAGVQTTPQMARGYVPGSAVAFMNGNLAHACDFKFIFNINIAPLGLINPVTAIQNAIRNGKLKATNRMRSLLQDAIQAARLVIDTLIKTFGLDPSGQISFYWSVGKDLIRKVNETIEFVAEKAEIVFEWVFFAQEIAQLIAWIESLPGKIKNLLLGCLASFTNSIQQIANDIKYLPNKVTALTTAQITQIANQFTQAAQLASSTVTAASTVNNSNLPDAAIQALSTPTTDNAQKIADNVTAYITTSIPSANSVAASTTVSKMANSSGP